MHVPLMPIVHRDNTVVGFQYVNSQIVPETKEQPTPIASRVVREYKPAHLFNNNLFTFNNTHICQTNILSQKTKRSQ